MIEVRNIEKSYGKKKIFRDVNIDFHTNTSYAIIGPSGSGKSTFLNAVARLEKPDKGTIRIDGKDIWKMKEQDYFKKHLGYVFQNYALIEEETVWDNLKMLAKKEEVVTALRQVGLDESYLKYRIYELSGGQAQRVSIARLLVKKARVILADEPTGALDKKTGNEIILLLLGLVSPETVLIVATHDEEVCKQVDTVIDLSNLL